MNEDVNQTAQDRAPECSAAPMDRLGEASLPRVLIVSVNPLSETSNNGKTYASFFEGYPKDKLAQLYFHRELPTSHVTDNYYRVSDEDVLLYVLKRATSIGGSVEAATQADHLVPPVITRTLAGSELVRLVRSEFLARMLPRAYRDVTPWLKSFAPELIFFSGGDAIYLFPLVQRISAAYGAPLVTYVTDDYILPLRKPWALRGLVRTRTRKAFLRLTQSSARVLTIGDRMSKVYFERYGLRSTPIMNLVSVNREGLTEDLPDAHGRPLVLTYAGGLHLNRWETLALIGQSLDRIAKSGHRGLLRIYTGTEIDRRMRAALEMPSSVRVEGSVPASALESIYRSSDLLVHVESFAESDREATRLSISTKVPEYLAAGRPVLAIGPDDVASVAYLRDSGSAFVLSDLEPAALDKLLSGIIIDESTRGEMASRAIQTAMANHEATSGRRRLWEDLVDVVCSSARQSDTRVDEGTRG